MDLPKVVRFSLFLVGLSGSFARVFSPLANTIPMDTSILTILFVNIN